MSLLQEVERNVVGGHATDLADAHGQLLIDSAATVQKLKLRLPSAREGAVSVSLDR